VSRVEAWRAAARLAYGAALVAAVCGGPARLRAQVMQPQQPQPPPQEMTVDAESVSYDKKSDTVSAAGAVVVRRGESVLRADEVQLDRQTNEAQAQGNAILTTPDADIHASSMSLDLDDETGELTDAHIYSDRLGYTLSGQRIEKRVGQSYRIENGRFTTCNCASGPPTWSIAGDSIDVALNGYGYVQGGSFELLDWPVLWLPRAAFPVFRDRESGLLIPRVGFSNRRGFQLLQPYYWAINKSQDMTVSFDLETSLRVGLLDEYRYAFSRTSHGEFQVGYFNESLRGNSPGISVPPGINPVAPENRWGIIGNHTEGLGPITGYADVLLVGDDLFLREMNTFTANERKQIDLRTLPFTTSRIGLLEDWSRAFVQAEGIYYQDLVGPTVEEPNGQPNQDQSLTIQRMPEVDVTAQKQLGLGLMGDLAGSVTDFQRGTLLSQGTGLTGFRTDLHPAAELRLPLGPSLFGALHASFRETAYGLTQNEMANGFTGTFPPAGLISLPSTSSRQIFDVGGNVGTEFDRVYDFHYFGFDKLKNTIEPTLEYLYVPPVDQDDLPVFDGIDRINKRSLLTYGIASRLLVRTASTTDGAPGDVFELARLSATQSYDFIRDIAPTTALDPTSGVPLNPSKGDHFSDIDFALRVNPNTVTSLRAYATYDTSNNTLSSATVGIRFREPQRIFGQAIRPRLLTRAIFNVEYRFITDNILQMLSSSATLPLTDRIAALYAMRYDINTGTFLENYLGVRLLSSCDCWALNVGFTQTHNPNEVQFQAQFTLAGLGNNFGSLREY
jgi:LPS-assembly protein